MEKWKLLSSKLVFESKWLTLMDNTYELPNGQIQEKYYQIDKQHCVVVIAEKDEYIVVIQQYRRGVNEVLYELPAGLIDSDESVVDAALRELEEETGFTGVATFLNNCPAQPAFLSMKSNFVFVKISGKIEQNLCEDENINVTLMSKVQIDTMIRNGEITDLSFIAGMYLYELFRNEQ